MRKAASWRGSPIATSKKDFMHVLRLTKPKSSDVFYDLGCGYGRLCIWIAPRVKLAVGFETHYDRYKRAKLAVERSKLKNVEIRRVDFSRVSYSKATIIYSMVDTGLPVMARINRLSKSGTKFIQYARPNYPIKGKRLFGNYFMMKTPFERVKDQDEFARIFLGRKKATIEEMHAELGKRDSGALKREIRESESSWKLLFIR
jgi:SAM-dependent methyltransferase